MVEVLQIPRTVRSMQGSVSGSLCMFLRHLAYPCRCSDLIQRFGGQVPELCMITNTVMDLISRPGILIFWMQKHFKCMQMPCFFEVSLFKTASFKSFVPVQLAPRLGYPFRTTLYTMPLAASSSLIHSLNCLRVHAFVLFGFKNSWILSYVFPLSVLPFLDENTSPLIISINKMISNHSMTLFKSRRISILQKGIRQIIRQTFLVLSL